MDGIESVQKERKKRGYFAENSIIPGVLRLRPVPLPVVRILSRLLQCGYEGEEDGKVSHQGELFFHWKYVVHFIILGRNGVRQQVTCRSLVALLCKQLWQSKNALHITLEWDHNCTFFRTRTSLRKTSRSCSWLSTRPTSPSPRTTTGGYWGWPADSKCPRWDPLIGNNYEQKIKSMS